MIEGNAVTYRVFVRDWWKDNPEWPDGLEPYGGAPRRTIARRCTEDEARRVAKDWNAKHKPGRYSRKAEYERE